jgi:uncharacterized protein
MIIDAHAHLGPGLKAEVPFGPVYNAETPTGLLALMDRVGIDKAIVFAPNWQGGWHGDDFIDPNYEQANAAIGEAVRQHAGRLVGFARVNPKFGGQATTELEARLNSGFRGLKLDNEHDGYSPTNLQLLGPLMEICAHHAAPVIVHTGFHPAEPLLFLPLARAFPHVNFILGHMGYRIVADAIIAARRSDNLYLETSAQMPHSILGGVRGLGADRVVFGTDLPYTIPEVEMRRVRSLGLTDAELEKILAGNIRRLLRLQKE